jgi:hypothetical protein
MGHESDGLDRRVRRRVSTVALGWQILKERRA